MKITTALQTKINGITNRLTFLGAAKAICQAYIDQRKQDKKSFFSPKGTLRKARDIIAISGCVENMLVNYPDFMDEKKLNKKESNESFYEIAFKIVNGSGKGTMNEMLREAYAKLNQAEPRIDALIKEFVAGQMDYTLKNAGFD